MAFASRENSRAAFCPAAIVNKAPPIQPPPALKRRRCWDSGRREHSGQFEANPTASARDVRCQCDFCSSSGAFVQNHGPSPSSPRRTPRPDGIREGLGALKGPGAACHHRAGSDTQPWLSIGIQGGKNTGAHQGRLKGRAASGFVPSRIPRFTTSLTHDGQTTQPPPWRRPGVRGNGYQASAHGRP